MREGSEGGEGDSLPSPIPTLPSRLRGGKGSLANPFTSFTSFTPLYSNMSNPLRARSLHRRHHELRAFSDPRRPARSDGLQAREETHALRTVDIVISEQGALPA